MGLLIGLQWEPAMIRRQVVVPAPLEEVWEYLTEPDDDLSWLGGHLTWSPEEGGDLRFEENGGRVRRGVVETVRPGRFVRFRWWPEAGDDPEPVTEVSYLLEPDDEATRLTVSERVAPPSTACSLASGGRWTAGDDRAFQAWARARCGSPVPVG